MSAKNQGQDAYKEVCSSYRAIDDFRSKLLGFLPLVTSGIFLLVSDKMKPDLLQEQLSLIGVFGLFITIGLLLYDLHGINKCHSLIEAGRKIEREVGISGQFSCGPILDRINEPLAAAAIYSTVLAMWTYLVIASCTNLGIEAKRMIVIVVFVLGFVVVLGLDHLFYLSTPGRRNRGSFFIGYYPGPVEEHHDPSSPVPGACVGSDLFARFDSGSADQPCGMGMTPRKLIARR